MNPKLKCALVFLSFSIPLLAAMTALAGPATRRATIPVADRVPYPNTTAGLHQLVADMLDAQRSGGPEAVAPYIGALTLPDSAAWFSNTFGDANGQQFAIFYDAWAGFRNSQLTGDLVRALAARMAQIEALRFTKPGDAGTTDRDNLFLSLRQQPEPLYVVNFKSASGASMRWAYFVFDDGTFRYLGELPDLRLIAKAAAPAQEEPSPQLARRIRVGGDVMGARIERQVIPVYPPEAQAAHIEGTVVLHATIAGDGTVKNLQYVSGPAQLASAATDAVKQWQYTPFVVNGQPVEVDTSIAVQFKLSLSDGTEASSQPAPSGAAEKPGVAAPAAKPAVPIPSYPDSTGGLSKMMKVMLDMAKHSDNQGLESYFQALVLPDPKSWLPAQFGADQGAEFAQSYQMIAASYLRSFFTNTIESDPNLQSSYVQVTRFKSSCDIAANESEYPLLMARQNQTVPLYEVRFVRGTNFYWLFPFAYVDGSFRYLGDLQIRAPQNHIVMNASSGDSSSGSPGSGVQMPKLIKMDPPAFPSGFNARNAGTVKLWGVIATDGSVTNLHVIQGTCDFARVTIDAVKKWRYTPLMVNGKPQEMIYPFQYSFGPGE